MRSSSPEILRFIGRILYLKAVFDALPITELFAPIEEIAYELAGRREVVRKGPTYCVRAMFMIEGFVLFCAIGRVRVIESKQPMLTLILKYQRVGERADDRG